MPSVSSSAATAITPTAAFTSLPTTVARADSASSALTQEKIEKVLAEVQTKLDDGRMAEAHLQLSSLYRNPDVPAARIRTVNELLDQMAGMVIYSRQHLLEQPYKVEPGDTLNTSPSCTTFPRCSWRGSTAFAMPTTCGRAAS
jgi:hypothetical protein